MKRYKVCGHLKQFIAELFEFVSSIVMSIPLGVMRTYYMKIILKKCGKGVSCMKFVRFYSPHRISIGNNVFINRNVMLDGRCGLMIGDSCDIGEYVKIWSLTHNPADNEHKFKGGKTIIEDHCWIAPWSIIFPGVKIGRGAVVATGAIVTKDVQPLTIVAGVPAKKIGERKNDLHYKLNYHTYL
ncbi:hypothetical protein FACS189438_0500 [Bacteroidia bacterium]|nr:hypothetical protein FACS189438_0500 [Bacteroidia bacterium]